MKRALRGASGAAFLAGLAGIAPAFAQQTQTAQVDTQAPAPQTPASQLEQVEQPEPQVQTPERVVVTGQLIAGESEDAPSPVEVYDLGALTQQGAPTAAEFLRTLTISSEAFGEADVAIAGAAAGLATVNLRGLGVGRTLVLLNGNRFNSGAITDVNTLPTMAIGRIDVLKDGASVTYGAGAVGGVLNYITRKNFDGFEIDIEKKFFEGSNGEDNIDALWGRTTETSNLLLAASYGKRHRLQGNQRDFTQFPYAEQPANWSAANSNPAQYLLSTTGAGIRDYTPASCNAIGGVLVGTLNNAAADPNVCSSPLYNLVNLIDEETYARGYAEFNFDVSDNMEFHVEAAYAKTENPNIWTANSLPSGGNVAQTFRGGFSIPFSQPTYTINGVSTGTTFINPFTQEFYTRAAANGLYSGPRVDLDTQAFAQWRPLFFGPNTLYPDGRRVERQQRERWGGAISLSGDFTRDSLFGQFLPEDTTYAFTAYYSRYQNESSRPDFIVSRLQNALNGYGGAGCSAVDRVPTIYTRIPDRSEFPAGAAGTTAFNAAVAAAQQNYDGTVGIQSDTAPGTNGCVYFNPFASSFETSFINGAPNPAYAGAAFENSPELMDWLTHDRRLETTNEALTFNVTFTGEVPAFELPGGPIAWGVGSEWRQTEIRIQPRGTQEEIEIAGLRCPWDDDMSLAPTVTGLNACYADRGPVFSSGVGPQRPAYGDRQVISYYGELQFPVLENLNIQLAGRREEYASVTGDIWKIAGKYDVLPELSFRASYSTNFQAPPDDLGVSGDVQGTAYVGSLLRAISTTTRTASGITPEDDKATNIGVIYAPEIFGGQLRASLDFWEIIIDKEVGDTALANVFASVFRNPTTGAPTASPTSASLAVCSAPFIGLVTFTEPCNDTAPLTDPARTTGADLLNVFRFTLNTGGFITNGVDISFDYTHDIGPGTLFAAVSGTNVLVYKVRGYNLPNGVEYQASFDGLAWTNLTRGGTIMPRWRANATLGYTIGDHRFNLRANYISGVRDETTPTPVGVVNGVTQFPKFGTTPKEYMDFDFNYIFTSPVWQDLELRLSVLNLTDKDPMPAQHSAAGGAASPTRLGYYPGYGNPRGRQIELGVTKKF